MQLALLKGEREAITEMATAYGCSEHQIVISALRLYHQYFHRLKDGETCSWSGDKARALERYEPA